ncbi:MAG: diguanylate cyclase [Planctomycetota bacterium]|mgnify:CR=1 FL=1
MLKPIFSLQSQRLKYKIWIIYALLSVIPTLFFIYLLVKISPGLSVNTSILLSIFIGFGGILLMSIAAFWLLRRSLSSIEQLNQKTENFLAATRKEGIKLATGDEVEKMGHYFDKILSELQSKMKEANEYARELSDMNKKLAQMAIKDNLTGLFNRSYIMERLESEFLQTQQFKHPLSLMMIDIDNFKKCNDTYGHLAGDRILQEVALLINSQRRPIDTPARYGGEEFLIIMPEIPKIKALDLAENIRQQIANHSFIIPESSQPIHLTISVGVIDHTNGITNFEEMIHLADQALYEAKRKGKNYVC